jgi:hypothetical protein
VTHLIGRLQIGAACGVCLVILACKTPPPPPPPPPPAPGANCGGVNRWDVKTASDGAINQVNVKQTVDTNVATLTDRMLVKPWKKKLPRQIGFDVANGSAVEGTDWKLCVEVVDFKLEADDDIHLHVIDPKKPKPVLTVEFPDTNCMGAVASPLKAQMAQARQDLTKAFGNPPKGGYKGVKGTALITGIGFFDQEHIQGAETIEVHPGLSFDVTTCTVLKYHSTTGQ